MRVEYVRTYLRMTNPDELRPAEQVPELNLQPVEWDAPRLRETYDAVGGPHRWSLTYADAASWRAEMGAPDMKHWLVVSSAQLEEAGVVSLQPQPAGQVELVVFGLVPQAHGHGWGGDVLTRAVRLGWAAQPVDDQPIDTVWLHTSSLDHPRAIHNYLRRGFREYRTEARSKEVPD